MEGKSLSEDSGKCWGVLSREKTWLRQETIIAAAVLRIGLGEASGKTFNRYRHNQARDDGGFNRGGAWKW